MDEKPGKPNRLDALTLSLVRVLVATGVIISALLLAFCLIKAPAQQLETEIKIGLSFLPVVVLGAIAWIVDKRGRSRRTP